MQNVGAISSFTQSKQVGCLFEQSKAFLLLKLAIPLNPLDLMTVKHTLHSLGCCSAAKTAAADLDRVTTGIASEDCPQGCLCLLLR
jgi:hypothetical protein